ncbi:NIF3-like protein [Gottschalkia acidurici 9a]|uniref:GTP cyclohydrolase 1 type 2 homolog n=1 Tax=Gottschalkia acidurici (strain ATCC 7906 / DSM 604 / BCRC 14475 / CIP 104303 / KCTC 5404 / NCIMB 10678 / 9a) TaxID=1128398 RepID=K0B159_GOTA9|nr:Nif3-like dinuclear metal center hexameric protein [Gottschalkia acidurici]AFS78807.1 NIF3-like protein [Gottschalkia acidurici 9a]
MKASEIVSILNKLAPSYLIDTWDNSGLQVGSLKKDVKNILITLDLGEKALNKAIENKVDMIITHHPLFFGGIKHISLDNPNGDIISEIIKNDITVFSAHTNLDMCNGGVNDILADKLNLKDTRPMSKFRADKLYKICVFVPVSHTEIVRKALGDSGAGFIGNYSHCTFNTKGVGTFLPREGTNPYIGELGRIESVEEEKIETIVDEHILQKVISSMVKAHPYEEVAYDIYPLYNKGKSYGYGRVGKLDKNIALNDFGRIVKEKLDCETVRVYGDLNREIKKVALCGGSGGSFIKDAHRSNADVYITGDIKYHDAQLASELGISIIDAGHFETEKHSIDFLKEYIQENTNQVKIITYNESIAPFITI